MDRLGILMQKFPNEFENFLDQVINKFWDHKFPNGYVIGSNRKPNTVFKFKVLGKVYDSNKFVDNYRSFFRDISKIVPYDTMAKCIRPRFISCCYNPNWVEYEKINDDLFLNLKTTTNHKIEVIKNLCEHVGITIEELP